MESILAHADPLTVGIAIGLGLAELIRRVIKKRKEKPVEAEVG